MKYKELERLIKKQDAMIQAGNKRDTHYGAILKPGSCFE